MDCVVDGLDNMFTRYIINRACVKHKIPYVFGGALGFEGNISVFAPPKTPCLECIVPGLDDDSLPTCETRGVLGATTGIIGSIQAMEAIKLCAGIDDTLEGKLLVCDLKEMTFMPIRIFKRPDCPVCQGRIPRLIKGEERLVWLCGRNTVNVNPPSPMELEIDEVYERLKHFFKILIKSPLVIVFKHEDVEVSLFKKGRMLIKNVKDEETALRIYRNAVKSLGKERNVD